MERRARSHDAHPQRWTICSRAWKHTLIRDHMRGSIRDHMLTCMKHTLDARVQATLQRSVLR
jgi:hypothetical protein